MQRTIKSNIRRGLIIILTLLLVGSTGLTAWWFKQPTEKAKEVPVYTCQQQIQVDYRVFITPNNFFSEAIVGPGQAYITPLTQYIETVLNYNFSADTSSDISGQYQVDATLTGYILQETNDGKEMKKEKVKVWTKPYALFPPTPFSAQDRKLEVKQVVPVDIQYYAAFAEQIVRELKFSADVVELTVTYHVQGNALTPAGQVNEPLKAVMVIPVKGTSFMVHGTLADKKEKSITKSETEVVPSVKTARIGFAVAAILFALLLILVVFKTTAEIKDPEEKKLQKIIRKHGDRIVAGFSWVPALSEKNIIVLNSFDDLVKVADEVEQPILYNEVNDTVHSFYVINEPLIYHYSLKISTQKNIYQNQITTKTDSLKI